MSTVLQGTKPEQRKGGGRGGRREGGRGGEHNAYSTRGVGIRVPYKYDVSSYSYSLKPLVGRFVPHA